MENYVNMVEANDEPHDERMDDPQDERMDEGARAVASYQSDREASKKAFNASNMSRERFEDTYAQQIIDAVMQRCPTATLRRPGDNEKEGGWATSNFYSHADLAKDVDEVLRCIDTTRFIEVHTEGEPVVKGVLIYIGELCEQW